MRAHAAVAVSACGITRLRSEPPLALRPIGDEVWIVGSAGGPVGGDELALDVAITGASAGIRSAAAQVVLPSVAGGPVRVEIDACVDGGGSLDWAPEPVIVTARARLESRAIVRLAAGARLRWRDELVLGRHAEAGGDARALVRVERDGVALVHHELSLHPASVGAHRVVSTTVVVDDRPPPTATRRVCGTARAARFPLEAGGWMLIGLGDTLEAVRALVTELDHSP